MKRTAAFCMMVVAAASFHRAMNQTVDRPAAIGRGTSLTTEERVYGAAWWPTQTTAKAPEYAGEIVCATCHGDVTAIQHTTAMDHAAAPASTTPRLAQAQAMNFHEGSYTYSVGRDGSGAAFSVSDGVKTESLPIAWSFGNAKLGQTYLLKGRNALIEGRLSYYTGTNALDVTTGHSQKLPGSLHDALGHVLSSDTAERCFGCHTTESSLDGVFAPEKAIPGVTCEACHGPGARHVEAMRSGRMDESASTITNPGSLSPAQSVDFCGACHRTSADVTVYMPANLGTTLARFQPYRLEKSRCWGAQGDARVTCIACHDPHVPLVRDAAAYDSKCLACHASTPSQHPGATPARQPTGKAAACKVGTNKCVTCHMPRVEVPQTHASFTDHDIRIVGTSGFAR